MAASVLRLKARLDMYLQLKQHGKSQNLYRSLKSNRPQAEYSVCIAIYPR